MLNYAPYSSVHDISCFGYLLVQWFIVDNVYCLIKHRTHLNWRLQKRRIRNLLLVVLLAALLKYLNCYLWDRFTLPCVAIFFVIKLSEQKGNKEMKKPKIGYGVGMACSFFEGYLNYILPNDGVKFYGVEEIINLFEAKNSVSFPVKKLFIVITKSLHSPPNLKEFNKPQGPDRPYIELCTSMEEQTRDVAGVKDRVYKNCAYMIHRPVGRPVYLAAECATPLLTLHKVKQRRALYPELADADFDEIVGDFCSMLERILKNSHECRDKCVLVHYDDLNPNKNLSEVLLQKIEEIEPHFEDYI